MTCSAYWAQQLKNRVYPLYPLVRILQARAYDSPRPLDVGLVPGIEPSGVDPIKGMLRYLAGAYDPAMSQDDLVLMFHPRGGFSVLDRRIP